MKPHNHFQSDQKCRFGTNPFARRAWGLGLRPIRSVIGSLFVDHNRTKGLTKYLQSWYYLLGPTPTKTASLPPRPSRGAREGSGSVGPGLCPA